MILYDFVCVLAISLMFISVTSILPKKVQDEPPLDAAPLFVSTAGTVVTTDPAGVG